MSFRDVGRRYSCRFFIAVHFSIGFVDPVLVGRHSGFQAICSAIYEIMIIVTGCYLI